MKTVTQEKAFEDMSHDQRMSYALSLFDNARKKKEAFKLSNFIEVVA